MRPEGSAEALGRGRQIAARLLQQGKGVREVSRLIGVAPSSVCRWKETLEQGGLEALHAKPHPGRTPRLKQKKQLQAVLLKGATVAGFATDLWTLKRVAQVIAREFGVTYHPYHLSCLAHPQGDGLECPEARAASAKASARRGSDRPVAQGAMGGVGGLSLR